MTERVVAITGGHGVLGKAVLEAALQAGLKVAVIDHAQGHAVPEGVLEVGGVDLTDADQAQKHFQPAFRVKAVDTTAAGDTFTGFLMGGLLAGRTVPEAMELAAKASAIAVTRPGASPSIPTLEEVLNWKGQD